MVDLRWFNSRRSVTKKMPSHKQLTRIRKMYKKLSSAREWLDIHIQNRPSIKTVHPWNGMTPEKTVKLFLVEHGIKVHRNRLPTIDFKIEIDGGWKKLEVKSDILRPGQENADEYAVILYPNRDNQSKECIILTTFDIPNRKSK